MLAAKFAEFIQLQAFFELLLILFRKMGYPFAFRAFKFDQIVL